MASAIALPSALGPAERVPPSTPLRSLSSFLFDLRKIVPRSKQFLLSRLLPIKNSFQNTSGFGPDHNNSSPITAHFSSFCVFALRRVLISRNRSPSYD